MVKNTIKIALLTLVILAIAAIAFISPITKYLIEKYDKKYTGREIKIAWVYVNPFTGYIHLEKINIYEFEQDSLFFSADGININIAMLKLLFKKYEFTSLTIDKPIGLIKQKNKEFNFSDLIVRFSKKDSLKKAKNVPIQFSIQQIKINDGTLYYKESVTPISYFIKKVNLESTGIYWNVDTIPIRFDFISGIGSGEMKGIFTVNSKNNNYALKIIVKQFDLNILGQYIKDLSNYGNFKAFLDADFNSKGNLINREDGTNSGLIKISNFHFGKTAEEDYASFKELKLVIHEISPKKLIYAYDSVELRSPFFKYEKYDYLDNVQRAFGKSGANVRTAVANSEKFNLVIEIAKYIKVLSKNFLRSNYKVNHIGIYNGEFQFNDYSLNEKFSIAFNPFTFEADSVEKSHNRVEFRMAAGIKPFGNTKINISINPKDSSDFDLTYTLQKIPTTLFNPYFKKYTSFPLDRGSIEANGSWHVRNGLITSKNHLLIIDPRVGNKIKNKNSNWLPMRLILFVVRERGNVIDYEIPITGDLNNPKFVLRDAIFDALGNVFIKPPTTPYLMKVRQVETEIEKSLMLTWEFRGTEVSNAQKNFLEAMAKFVAENPEVKIKITPNNYRSKEFESILLYEAKKQFYCSKNNKNKRSYSNDDSLKVEKMSIKDALFVRYLHQQINDSLMFTVQEKCAQLFKSGYVDAKVKAINKIRMEVFLNYFKSYEKQILIQQEISITPYNGYSFYKITYEGNFPEKLTQAYHKMRNLNNSFPRNKYKDRRQSKTK